MKKTTFLFAAMMVALCAAATDRFYIEDFTINPGETLTVSIMLDNEAQYTAFQSDIYLPEGLTASSFALTERKNANHSLSATAQPDGSIRLLSYSLKVKPYSGNSGALVTFNVTAADDFTGPATIAIRNILFTTTSGVEIPFSDETCTVTLPATGLKGDVNDNGEVTIADVTTLIDYLLGGNVSPFNADNADVNSNGDITIADVTTLIDMLLSGS
ncbi:MAG: hypothetical protein IKZ92_09650 [Muribaculaceae bacterium]|nr:hypothetical protein [Muribaculaceae bacterium]